MQNLVSCFSLWHPYVDLQGGAQSCRCTHKKQACFSPLPHRAAEQIPHQADQTYDQIQQKAAAVDKLPPFDSEDESNYSLSLFCKNFVRDFSSACFHRIRITKHSLAQCCVYLWNLGRSQIRRAPARAQCSGMCFCTEVRDPEKFILGLWGESCARRCHLLRIFTGSSAHGRWTGQCSYGEASSVISCAARGDVTLWLRLVIRVKRTITSLQLRSAHLL